MVALRCCFVWASWLMNPAADSEEHHGSDNPKIWHQWEMILICCCPESARIKKIKIKTEIKFSTDMGTRVRDAVLYSEQTVSLWRSPLAHAKLHFFFFVFPGLPSDILRHQPLPCTAPHHNLQNAAMGQANQPLGRLWGPAKQFQLWHN